MLISVAFSILDSPDIGGKALLNSNSVCSCAQPRSHPPEPRSPWTGQRPPSHPGSPYRIRAQHSHSRCPLRTRSFPLRNLLLHPSSRKQQAKAFLPPQSRDFCVGLEGGRGNMPASERSRSFSWKEGGSRGVPRGEEGSGAGRGFPGCPERRAGGAAPAEAGGKVCCPRPSV